jgi:hypothetical protein
MSYLASGVCLLFFAVWASLSFHGILAHVCYKICHFLSVSISMRQCYIAKRIDEVILTFILSSAMAESMHWYFKQNTRVATQGI